MGAAKKVGGVTAAAAAVGAATFSLLPLEQRALLQQAVTGECPRTVACLKWEPSLMMTDGSAFPIGSVVTYTVWLGDAANAINRQVGTTTALQLVVPNPTKETRTFYFAVTATVPNKGTSVLSNSATKLLRAPGPTEGRVEGPSDGGIED